MIVITCPGFSPHGGIRILLEWANRLPDVTILNTSARNNAPSWFNLNPSVKITQSPLVIKGADILIIGSPHGIKYQDYGAKRTIIFLQMMEHLFKSNDTKWMNMCRQTYTSPHPMILIAHWNFSWCLKYGRIAPTYYVGNGVNLNDFPISEKSKDGRTVLLESPIPSNAAKDIDKIGLRVAEQLRADGYRIISYGLLPMNGESNLVDEFHLKPSLEKLNDLYSEATIMIKATRYDARSTAPLEAMTKGCVTARALTYGDDDLIHGVNCLRSGYNEDDLYDNAKQLLTNESLRKQLSENCIYHVQKWSWEYYMDRIKEILFDHPNAKLSLL